MATKKTAKTTKKTVKKPEEVELEEEGEEVVDLNVSPNELTAAEPDTKNGPEALEDIRERRAEMAEKAEAQRS